MRRVAASIRWEPAGTLRPSAYFVEQLLLARSLVSGPGVLPESALSQLAKSLSARPAPAPSLRGRRGPAVTGWQG